MKKTKILILSASLGAMLLGLPVSAELTDSPYFNLWTDDGSNGGNGNTVMLCGTQVCDGTVSDPVADINYATFTALEFNTGKGSGAIDPFLRFQHNEGEALGSATIERAFNTSNVDIGVINDVDASGAITDTYANQAKDSVAGGQNPDDFNHAIKLSDLLAIDGQYSFFLDINEPGGTKSTLTLDELAFFVSTSDMLNEFTRDKPLDNGPQPNNLATGEFTDTDCGVGQVCDAFKVW
ncbi:MAG: hypothetical protein ACI9BW_003428, partial [Gammaproteobacteria bacterium]